MEAPVLPIVSAQGITSKSHIISQKSPPPAYSPRRRIHAQRLVAQHPQAHAVLTDGLAALITSQQDKEDGDTDSDMCQSSISLRINTSIRISSDNNYVCIESNPSDHANAIARAVVTAIQENSSGRCGIPMIDEDGRPRPIKVEIDAGVEFLGSGNVVGGGAIINKALSQRRQFRCQNRHLEESSESDGHDSIAPIKRRRCR